MKVFQTIEQVQAYLQSLKGSVGFVPTMGALHQGHISLIHEAGRNNDYVVCSIFVNPTQFNDPKDLEKYPRTIENDSKMLAEAGCDVLFAPSVTEIYPQKDQTIFDFGELDKVMEGEFRPGHFNGVAMVLKRLFEIVKPQKAYFGEKDFQQLAVVRALKQKLNLNTEIIGCPIIREPDGLAMSSRNVLLSQVERKSATRISQTLFKARNLINEMTVKKLEDWVISEIEKDPVLKMEYFKIVDGESLKPLKDWDKQKKAVGCIAVKAGNTRLIDNIVLIP